MGLVPLFSPLPLVFRPALSFFQPAPVTVPLYIGEGWNTAPYREPANAGARGSSLLSNRRSPFGLVSSPLVPTRAARLRCFSGGERMSGERPPSASAAAPPPSVSSTREMVSYLQNPETGSRIWLVGIIHEARAYAQLVQSVIREIKPEVVMLELDAESIFVLPPGKAHQSRNGLWWWKPAKQDPVGKAGKQGFGFHRRAGSIKFDQSAAQDKRKEVSEILTAVREARTCGARVLLGDRSDQESKQREKEADRADSEMLRVLGEGSTTTTVEERKRLERAGRGLQMLMGLIERRRAFGFEMPETRAIVRKHSEWHRLLGPRAFEVVVAERDEVMAQNLMLLRGIRTTVAVVGSAHLDGMERIMSANGWVVVDESDKISQPTRASK